MSDSTRLRVVVQGSLSDSGVAGLGCQNRPLSAGGPRGPPSLLSGGGDLCHFPSLVPGGLEPRPPSLRGETLCSRDPRAGDS